MRTPSGIGPQATRDARIARVIQARLDIIEDEISDHDAQAERHWRLVCWHLAQADNLAQARFELTVAIARIERRLIRAASARQVNGRAAS